MFRKLIRNKKAQQTAEYALLIALVVAAVIAMQTYAQRAIQARIKAASDYLAVKTSSLDQTEQPVNQYEPYYLRSMYQVDRNDTTIDIHTNETVRRELDTDSTRKEEGFQEQLYQPGVWGGGAGFDEEQPEGGGGGGGRTGG